MPETKDQTGTVPANEDTKKGSSMQRVLRFFSQNPWVGFLGVLVGLVSGALGIYGYFRPPAARPDLRFTRQAIHTSLVRSGVASDLQVSYKGRPVVGDISAVQVAVWNAGDATIKREDVLTPVVVSFDPSVPIMEAVLRSRTHPATGISLDTSDTDKGIVRISWERLEHNDGASIQLIYAGPVGTSVLANEGVVEGQREGVREAVRVSPVVWLVITLGFVFLAPAWYRLLLSVAENQAAALQVAEEMGQIEQRLVMNENDRLSIAWSVTDTHRRLESLTRSIEDDLHPLANDLHEDARRRGRPTDFASDVADAREQVTRLAGGARAALDRAHKYLATLEKPYLGDATIEQYLKKISALVREGEKRRTLSIVCLVVVVLGYLAICARLVLVHRSPCGPPFPF